MVLGIGTSLIHKALLSAELLPAVEAIVFRNERLQHNT
jgi:hypothetical protein